MSRSPEQSEGEAKGPLAERVKNGSNVVLLTFALFIEEGELMQLHVALYGGARVVSGKSVVDLSFAAPAVTLAELLEKLIATYPRVRPYLLDTSGMLHTSIRVLINNERPEPDATLETLLRDEDRVALLVAVAGGALC